MHNWCFWYINFNFFGKTDKFGLEQNNLKSINRSQIAYNNQKTHSIYASAALDTNNYPYRLYIPSLLWIMDLHPKTWLRHFKWNLGKLPTYFGTLFTVQLSCNLLKNKTENVLYIRDVFGVQSFHLAAHW